MTFKKNFFSIFIIALLVINLFQSIHTNNQIQNLRQSTNSTLNGLMTNVNDIYYRLNKVTYEIQETLESESSLFTKVQVDVVPLTNTIKLNVKAVPKTLDTNERMVLKANVDINDVTYQVDFGNDHEAVIELPFATDIQPTIEIVSETSTKSQVLDSIDTRDMFRLSIDTQWDMTGEDYSIFNLTMSVYDQEEKSPLHEDSIEDAFFAIETHPYDEETETEIMEAYKEYVINSDLQDLYMSFLDENPFHDAEVIYLNDRISFELELDSEDYQGTNSRILLFVTTESGQIYASSYYNAPTMNVQKDGSSTSSGGDYLAPILGIERFIRTH